MESTGPSFLSRVVAVVILAVAAWVLFKVVISVIAGVAFMAVAIVLLVGAVWAVRVLRR